MNIPKLIGYLGKPITAITKNSNNTWVCPLRQEPPADIVDLTTTNRVIQSLIEQRNKMTNTIDEGRLVEETLNEIKEGSFRINFPIRLNLIMRSCKSAKADQICETNAQTVDALVAQSHLTEDITLFRGATPYDFALPGTTTSEFIEKFYKKGRVFRIPIFPETSLSQEVARRFVQKSGFFTDGGILFKFNCKKGTNGIYMDQLRSDRFHSDINFDDEYEIMLGRNLIGQFKSHTSYRAYEEIEVDILPKKPWHKRIHEFWNET